MNKKIYVREGEIHSLINEIAEKGFLQKRLFFEEGFSLDLDKLVVAGHSMGGMAAILAARSNPYVKCLLTHDPWLMPAYQQILDGKITGFKEDQPTFLLNTATFHDRMKDYPFDHLKCFETLRDKHIKARQLEDVVITGKAMHVHQTDNACLLSYEVELADWLSSGLSPSKMPRDDGHLLYALHTWLWISFLHKVGMHNDTFDVGKLDRAIARMRRRYVTFNKRLEYAYSPNSYMEAQRKKEQ